VSDYFRYLDGQLCAGRLPLADIAERWGTPCYVYGEPLILRNYRALATAFARRRGGVCYAVKANSNLAVLQTLARAGAGFDIVSGGELARVLRAGGDPARVVFSGGKMKKGKKGLDYLPSEVYVLDAESGQILHRISKRGALGCRFSADGRYLSYVCFSVPDAARFREDEITGTTLYVFDLVKGSSRKLWTFKGPAAVVGVHDCSVVSHGDPLLRVGKIDRPQIVRSA